MRWFLLISSLAVVHSKPQYPNRPDGTTVEIEKQELVEIQPESRALLLKDPSKIDDNTKEILRKIAEVNEKHGLTQKKKRPSYFHFPLSYQRSQDNHRQGTDFKFPRDPFSNPILDYIEAKSDERQLTNRVLTAAQPPEEDEAPPGHFIKRKITHQQTMLLPVYGSGGYPTVAAPPQYYPTNMVVPVKNATKSDLERQTVDNIRNIISTSQPQYANPYQFYNYYPPDSNNYRLYGPFVTQEIRPGKQQWPQWPLAQYFPIVIKDPVMQMVNAFTSMIEYGPAASTGTACGTRPSKRPAAIQSRNSHDPAETDTTNEELTTVLDIEGLKIDGTATNYREAKQDDRSQNSSKSAQQLLKNPFIKSVEINKKIIGDKSSQTDSIVLPYREKVPYDDELDEAISEKAEQQLSHDGNKKFFSKDNTGSGIFIHKIKVRKGGVAIAGPGGIATAGSGGTAIVGPNGFAYTQPNSLAIAGSGTKVIAVEPDVNLSEIISATNGNRTGSGTKHGRFPRIGKVVAVGPVIYYNRG